MMAMQIDKPIVIRGHTLLCLQGFRGEGYDPNFIQNMSKIHQLFFQRKETLVKVVFQPDAVCDACPNLGPSGCRLQGEGFEQAMALQDREVMRRLSLKDGEALSWEEILKRIAERIHPNALPEICGSCPWLSLGYCQEGIGHLRREKDEKGIGSSSPRV